MMTGLARMIMAVEPARAPAPPGAGGREQHLRQRLSPRRRHPDQQGSLGRDRQHRRRRPAGPGRCARRGRPRAAGAAHRRRDPDRCRPGGARHRLPGPLLDRRQRSPPTSWRPATTSPSRSGACRSIPATTTCSRAASPISRAPGRSRWAGPSRPPSSSPASSSTPRLMRISTSSPGTTRAAPGGPRAARPLGLRALFAMLERRFGGPDARANA
jgi:hypothetical protein